MMAWHLGETGNDRGEGAMKPTNLRGWIEHDNNPMG